ncbi:hypothetical protein [Peribacillus frigoritolerans]
MGVVNLKMQLAGFIAPLTIGFVIDALDDRLMELFGYWFHSESFVLSLL